MLCGLYRGAGLPALVRVVDPEEARQALDGGAAGVVLPYMETVEEVKALRGAVKLRCGFLQQALAPLVFFVSLLSLSRFCG